jgi:hypothetical protein
MYMPEGVPDLNLKDWSSPRAHFAMWVFWLKSMRSRRPSENQSHFWASIFTGDYIPRRDEEVHCACFSVTKYRDSEVQFEWPLRFVKCPCPMTLSLHAILYLVIAFQKSSVGQWYERWCQWLPSQWFSLILICIQVLTSFGHLGTFCFPVRAYSYEMNAV